MGLIKKFGGFAKRVMNGKCYSRQTRGCRVSCMFGEYFSRIKFIRIKKPSLAKEWHNEKNKKLTPFDISLGSHDKVWWKCDKGPDHDGNNHQVRDI